MTDTGTKVLSSSSILFKFVSENLLNVPENHNFLQGNSSVSYNSRKKNYPSKSISSISMKRNLLFPIIDYYNILKLENGHEALSMKKWSIYFHLLIFVNLLYFLIDTLFYLLTLYSFPKKWKLELLQRTIKIWTPHFLTLLDCLSIFLRK